MATKQLDIDLMTSQFFAQLFHAYLECSDEVQAVIREMVEVVNDPDSTKEESDAALLTIAEALFPSHHNGTLGIDLDECEAGASPRIKELLREMDQQEAVFAERVNAALDATNMTQSDLASAIGVGQPAISMLLSRRCRPQRRTVEKIARVLDIRPSDLWPDSKDE